MDRYVRVLVDGSAEDKPIDFEQPRNGPGLGGAQATRHRESGISMHTAHSSSKPRTWSQRSLLAPRQSEGDMAKPIPCRIHPHCEVFFSMTRQDPQTGKVLRRKGRSPIRDAPTAAYLAECVRLREAFEREWARWEEADALMGRSPVMERMRAALRGG